MTAATEPVRIVRCPRCGGRSVYAASNPYRPFCSERCKAADFGAWASEAYRVDAAPPLEDDGDAGPAQQER
ncbi:MAG: DNA gyrase inhibitor YacG [Burkholderiaceae bacterium]|nr:DNA gyrase inhibitor YacG [Burkholderiaceae bacterium]